RRSISAALGVARGQALALESPISCTSATKSILNILESAKKPRHWHRDTIYGNMA
ncbi:hypothetical protein CPB97_004253, partial [Podila verticillata]